MEQLKSQPQVLEPNIEPEVTVDKGEHVYEDKAGVERNLIVAGTIGCVVLALVGLLVSNLLLAVAVAAGFGVGIFWVVRLSSSVKMTQSHISVGGRKVELADIDSSFGIWPAEHVFQASALSSFQHGLSFTRGQGRIRIYGGVVGRNSGSSWVVARNVRNGELLVFSPANRQKFIAQLRTLVGLRFDGSDTQIPLISPELRRLAPLSGYIDSPWSIAFSVILIVLIVVRVGFALLNLVA